ncbi:MAG: microtubule-binding protein, partial [Metallosphaera sp.]
QEGLDFSYVNRFTYKDKDGKYGKKGMRYEVDILAKNGKVYLVKVKSFAENDDIEWFDRKTDVIIDVLGIKNFVKLFLAVSVDKDALETAKDLGIRLVYGDMYERKKSTSDSEL